MSTSSLPINSDKKNYYKDIFINKNLINNKLTLSDSKNMNSIVQDVSSSPESLKYRSPKKSGKLNGKINSNKSDNSISPPVQIQTSYQNQEPSVSNSVVVSKSSTAFKPNLPSYKAATALGTIHKSLRKALNVHPEKYKRKNEHLLSRSLSPNLPAMPYIRSKSIDVSEGGKISLRQRESGSLSHDYNNALPIITLPNPLSPLADDINENQMKDSLLMSQDYDFSTDDESNPDTFDDIITINVSGMKFQTRERTLLRFPETILGNPFKRRRFYNSKTGEYFFDRSRSVFESILHIYQSNGEVIRSEDIPLEMYLDELRFFQFSDEILERFWINEGYVKPADVKLPTNKVLRKIWELMEYPDSSLAARICAFISISVIITSIVSFCLETLPDLKTETDDEREWNSTFFWVEFSCSIWFSLEFILRFIASPDKFDFIKSFLNLLDFVAVAPFFINIILSTGNTASSMSFSVLRIVRLVRVFRIFKLSRHSVGLQVLGKTFKASIQEFCLLIFFLVIALVLFSSGVYFAEQGEPNTKFTSIPASFWFVLATLSTVGYGDIVPTGFYGKIVGGGCALIGVITLALPVPIIVANFKHFYRQECRLAKMYTLAQQDNASNTSRKSFDVG